MKFFYLFFYLFFYCYLKILKHEKVKTKVKIITNLFLVSKNKLKLLKIIHLTQSQLFQELFVLNKMNFKKNRFFIEFGACDGLYYSNTLILEKIFGWKGILAEPSKYWQKNIKRNRKCNIFFGAVTHKKENNINFYENIEPALSGVFRNKNKLLKSYNIKCININILLEKYKAPKSIDYLSIDTEGNEYHIIKSLNFKKYRPKVITIEHNFRKDKTLIKKFLNEKKYKTFDLSLTKYDIWFYDQIFFKDF